ncbi:MAG TPA: ATP-binding protein [Microvirga sp.]|jgi:signal transduction histidine kinase|nr:ATP-binding protein [Microvirga sp.]
MTGPPELLLIIGQQVGLVAIVVVLVAALRRVDVAPLRSNQQALTGLVFGIGAVLAMHTRETLIPHMVYDTPSVFLAVSGLVCGPWSVLVTGVLTASYRVWTGSGSLAATLSGIVLVGIVGAGFHLHLKRRNRSFGYADLPVLALLTSAVVLSSFALLPAGMRAAAFQDLWLQLTARNVIGIGMLGGLLIEERRRRELAAELAAAAEHARRQAERIQVAEEHLRQAQKMQTLGQLTGGIAHDFNNLLVVVLGNAETLAEELGQPRHRALAEQILDAAERAADLTQKLLAFGRRQTLQRRLLDLSAVVQGMTPLLRRTLSAAVELRIEAAEAAPAWVDRTLLESAILNLVINARDAMPGGGRLTVATGCRPARPGEDDFVPGAPVVFVTVADEGCGMDAAVIERAFEPFFTTKGIGEGSGLGLSMVYGFAKQSGGAVRIASEVGRGTSVSILLQAAGRETPEGEGADETRWMAQPSPAIAM